MSAQPRATIVDSSKRLSIATVLEFPGVICPSASVMEKYAPAVQPLGEDRGWERLFEHLAAAADNEYAMIDSTIVRAHQHSAGAPKKR